MVVISSFACIDSLAQENSRFLEWMYEDVVGLLHSVNGQSPLVVVGITTSVAALSPADPRILAGIQETYSGGFADYLNLTNRLGDSEMKYPAFSVFAVSLFTDDTRFQDASFTSFQSILYAGYITKALKQIVGRARPETGLDGQAFAPFSGHRSFPSGHATAAFALVTPWVIYYPGPVTYSLFALSASTAIARIARDKHWPTDVVAGAAIGFFTARFLSRVHQNDDTLRGPRLRVAPALNANTLALQIAYQVD